MSTMSYSHGQPLGGAGLFDGLRGQRAKLTRLSLVAVAHLFLFYLAYSGLLTRAAQIALPQEVFVSLITPLPVPPKPAPPAPPKPVVLRPAPVFTPPPILNAAPAEHAISLPPPTPSVETPPAPVLAQVAPPAPPNSGPKTMTSGVEYLQPPRPDYPAISRRMGEQGKVFLRVLVNEKGRPEQVTVETSSGSSRLDEAGRQAALRALFKPHIEDGRPVAVYVIVPLNFELS